MKKLIFPILLAYLLFLGAGFINSAKAVAQPAGTNIISAGTVFMITIDGQRRPYTSAGAFLSYGFNSWNNTEQASSDDLALPIGNFIPPRDGKIICSDKGNDKGTCYLITGGKKAGFTSSAVFTQLGFNFKKVLSGDVSFLQSTDNISDPTQAHLPGTLINDNGTIKLVSSDGTVGIPDMATLISWGYSLDDVIIANAPDKALIQAHILNSHSPGQLAWDDNSSPVIPTSVLHIDLVAPNKILAGFPANIVIQGSGFKTGAKVDFGSGATVPISTVTSDKQIAVTIPGSMPALTYNLTVTNPDGQITTLNNALTVQSAPTVIPAGLSETQIFQKVAPSTALIFTGSGNNLSAGTGIILSADGYILTNRHVVAGFAAVDVYINDNGFFTQPFKHFTGTVLGTDSVNDLAIIKIPTTGLPPIEFGSSINLNLPVGSPVYALGFPLIFDVGASSVKILSGKIVGTASQYLQIDAPIQPGNSGGPLVNNQGQLVGINNLCITPSQVFCTLQGQAFAISIDFAKPLIPALEAGTNTIAPPTPNPTPTPTLSPASAVTAINSQFTNTQLTTNTLNQKIGSYVIQVGNTDGVRVSSLTVGLNGTFPLNSLANLYIVTTSANGTPVSASPVSPNANNNFSVNFTVGTNQMATVDVFADVGSTTDTSGTIQTTLNGSGSGSTNNNQPVFLNQSGVSGGAAVLGTTMTVGTGALSAASLTGSSPTSSFVLGGGQNQPAATYTFHVNPVGGVTITELGFNVVGGVANNTISSVMVAGSTGSAVGNRFLVTGLNIAVPVGNAGWDIPVTVTYSNVGSPSTVVDQTSQLSLTHVKYLAGNKYVVNGTAGFGDATPGVIGTGIGANTMFLAGTIPTVALQSNTNTLVAGSDIIGSITISATGGRLDMINLPINISTAGGTTVTSGTITLIEHNSSKVVAIGGNNLTDLGAPGTDNNTINFSGTDNLNKINSGTPVTFDVQISGVGGTCTTGGACSLVLQLGVATSFTFNDINGAGSSIPASDGSHTYIVNYPNNSVSIHN